MRRLCAAGFLALLIPAVAAAATVRIGPASNGRSIVLQKGDTLVVTLAAHRDGGYAWKVTHTSPAVMRLGKHKYIAPPDGSPTGASGIDIFRFRARGYGWTWVRLVEVRPFDPKHPNDTFGVRVKVERPRA